MFDWLQNIVDWLVYDTIGLSSEEHLAQALNFFIYDSIKIIILLFVIIFLMGIINRRLCVSPDFMFNSSL